MTTNARRRIPRLGMRIVKTGICVFCCLLLNYLFGTEVALYSSLAAITTMQATLESTKRTSAMELVGTALGGVAGMAILPLAQMIDIEWLYVFIMPAGMILVIYLCVVIRMPQAASLCGFVYIAVLVAPYDPSPGTNPYLPALYRITDTTIGVMIALLVNRFIAPPRLKAPRSVHVPANTYSSIYSRVKAQLVGNEHLILVDSSLMDSSTAGPRTHSEVHGIAAQDTAEDCVSIPVPLEFTSEKTLRAAYIPVDYRPVLFSLTPHDGYVDLPRSMYPVTVVWHTTAPSGRETYGIRRRRSAQCSNKTASLRKGHLGTTAPLYGPRVCPRSADSSAAEL